MMPTATQPQKKMLRKSAPGKEKRASHCPNTLYHAQVVAPLQKRCGRKKETHFVYGQHISGTENVFLMLNTLTVFLPVVDYLLPGTAIACADNDGSFAACEKYEARHG
ncbi:hypothetical protein [Flaviaesturariibacter amylovorans]|uniref:Transposase n=1 Tax=Flaviaesturariibacter amylovorans TaxID=1084520 RepID=A0ABP8GFH8_9BACT